MSRIIITAAMVAGAMATQLYAAGAEPNCEAVDRYISDTGKVTSKHLAEGIDCLADGLGASDAKTADQQTEAAGKIIILANKIIGNGLKPEPEQLDWSDVGTMVAAIALSTEIGAPGDPVASANTELARQIICQAVEFPHNGLALKLRLMNRFRCPIAEGSAEKIKEYANKIIGNG